uniref:Putative bel12 ag transposon polyprotein n=1 Tax=Lutzomyia longipalpis TaxID=7200 RepID=A0A1B0CCJ1_LUTLO
MEFRPFAEIGVNSMRSSKPPTVQSTPATAPQRQLINSGRDVLERKSRENSPTEHLQSRSLRPGHLTYSISSAFSFTIIHRCVCVVTVLPAAAQSSHRVHHHSQVRVRRDGTASSSAVISQGTSSFTGKLPNWTVNPDNIPIPYDLFLGDPTWHIPQQVDILLGGGFFAKIEKDQSHQLGKNLPKLKATHYGWILLGEHKPEHSDEETNLSICNLTTVSYIDDPPCKPSDPINKLNKISLSKEQKDVKDLYTANTRNERGKFGVYLPSQIKTALQSFRPKQKPHHNPEFKKTYFDILSKNLDLSLLHTANGRFRIRNDEVQHFHLQTLAADKCERFPLAIKPPLDGFQVDDQLASFSSCEEAQQSQQKLSITQGIQDNHCSYPDVRTRILEMKGNISTDYSTYKFCVEFLSDIILRTYPVLLWPPLDNLYPFAIKNVPQFHTFINKYFIPPRSLELSFKLFPKTPNTKLTWQQTIPTKPAIIATRQSYPRSLETLDLLWFGPFSLQTIEQWPLILCKNPDVNLTNIVTETVCGLNISELHSEQLLISRCIKESSDCAERLRVIAISPLYPNRRKKISFPIQNPLHPQIILLIETTVRWWDQKKHLGRYAKLCYAGRLLPEDTFHTQPQTNHLLLNAYAYSHHLTKNPIYVWEDDLETHQNVT